MTTSGTVSDAIVMNMMTFPSQSQSQTEPYYHVGAWRYCSIITSLQWRHNERDSVSNHQPHDCLLNRLFRRRSKKISKLRATGLYEGNSPVTGEFPAQRASNTENVSIWWRNHVYKDIKVAVYSCVIVHFNGYCEWLHSVYRQLNNRCTRLISEMTSLWNALNSNIKFDIMVIMITETPIYK